jgi:hypothetical protein
MDAFVWTINHRKLLNPITLNSQLEEISSTVHKSSAPPLLTPQRPNLSSTAPSQLSKHATWGASKGFVLAPQWPDSMKLVPNDIIAAYGLPLGGCDIPSLAVNSFHRHILYNGGI